MAKNDRISLTDEIDAWIAGTKIHPSPLIIDTKNDPPGWTYCYPEAYEAVARAQVEAEANGEPVVMPSWPPRRLVPRVRSPGSGQG